MTLWLHNNSVFSQLVHKMTSPRWYNGKVSRISLHSPFEIMVVHSPYVLAIEIEKGDFSTLLALFWDLLGFLVFSRRVTMVFSLYFLPLWFLLFISFLFSLFYSRYHLSLANPLRVWMDSLNIGERSICPAMGVKGLAWCHHFSRAVNHTVDRWEMISLLEMVMLYGYSPFGPHFPKRARLQPGDLDLINAWMAKST